MIDGDFNQAFASLSRRENLPAALTSEEWSSVPAEIRERAFFMSQVTDAEILQRFREGVDELAEGKKGQVTVEKEIHMWLQKRGYEPPQGKAGGLEDLSSLERINVVLRTNLAMARGHANWARKQTAIRAFPCQEFKRISKRKEPRDWDARWNDAKERLDHIPGVHPTLKVALLNHPIWVEISRFENPYPPFDFGSGMGVESVSRSEALEMGFKLDPNNDPMQRPFFRSMNEALEVTPQVSDPTIKQSLDDKLGRFGEREGDKLVFTDPDGTKEYPAKKLAEIWQRPAPEGHDIITQKDALDKWTDGIIPDAPEARALLRKLLNRIETATEIPVELWRSISLSAKEAMMVLRGLVNKEVSIPSDVAGWSWSELKNLTSGKSGKGKWEMILNLKGSTSAIDIRALRDGKPGYVSVGGTTFKVTGFTRDTKLRKMIVTLEEVLR